MRKLIKFLIHSLPSKVKVFLIRTLLQEINHLEKEQIGFNNLSITLLRAKRNGFDPSAVIDVGAFNGDWTAEVNEIFPKSPFYLFEPLPSKYKGLKDRFEKQAFKIFSNLLGNEIKQRVPFYAMESGSSVYEEATNFTREKIFVDMTTLDLSLSDQNLGDSILLKIDVQGFELEVLKGALSILNSVEMIALEVSFLNFNNGAPLFNEVLYQLDNYGFIPFDLSGFFRKSNDGGLIQADVIFIRKNSSLRNKINNFDQDLAIMMQY